MTKCNNNTTQNEPSGINCSNPLGYEFPTSSNADHWRLVGPDDDNRAWWCRIAANALKDQI